MAFPSHPHTATCYTPKPNRRDRTCGILIITITVLLSAHNLPTSSSFTVPSSVPSPRRRHVLRLSSGGGPQNGPEYYRPQSRGAPSGGDMAYVESNVRRSASTYQSIRIVGGSECSNDVYVRDPLARTSDDGGEDGSSSSPMSCRYFYVGKIARCDGTVTREAAVARVWNLIEEHACRLRPVELGRGYGRLEVWVSQKDMDLVKMEKMVEGSEVVGLSEVGFMAEVVTNRGVGLSVVRDGEGRVVR